MGVKEQLGITKRSTVLGLPIGPKQTDWSRVATLGGAAAVAGTRLVGRLRHHDGNGEAGGGLTEKLKEKGEEALEASPAGELIEKGKEATDTVTDVGGQISQAQEAASGASTGIGKVFKAAKSLAGGGDGEGGGDGDEVLKKQRLIIQEQIDIAVPREQVYNQWTQFEDFPTFTRATEQVEQEEDEATNWQAKILFSRRNWKAEIKEQIPDQRIVWETSGDVNQRGVVTFHELDENLTRVQVEMEYHPSGIVEKFGNLFLTVRHRVRKDLRLFKHYLEFESEETGAWRGRIEEGQVQEEDEGTEGGEEQEQNDAAKMREQRGGKGKSKSKSKDADEEQEDADSDRPRGEDGRFKSSSESEDDEETEEDEDDDGE